MWQNESLGSTDGGHVAIVRNGEPFDNTKIRQVLPASSGRTTIGIEGTAYFTLNTDATNGYAVLQQFDNKYGTRTFRCSGGGSKHVFAGAVRRR